MKIVLPEQELTIKGRTMAKFERQFSKGSNTECWEWNGLINRFGSARFQAVILNNETNTKTTTQTAHRFAWIVAHSSIPSHHQVVQHTCRNKLCVNPDHLELVTKAESLKSRWKKGNLNTIKVLNFKQAQEIRSLYHEGMSMIKLSHQFNVTYLTINKILNGTAHRITDAKLDKLEKENS